MALENTATRILPSQEKTWLKLYPKEIPDANTMVCTIYEYIFKKNENGMNDVALSYFDNEITFEQLFKNTQQTARALVAAGVKKGDILTVSSVTTPEIVYLFYALDLIGATANMVDPRTSTSGVHDYIEEAESEIAVTISAAYPRIAKASEGTKVKKILVISPADSLKGILKLGYKLKNKDTNTYAANTVLWKEFFESGNNGGKDFVPEYDPEHIAVVVHTGGTTGMPKGAMLSDKAVNSIALQYGINGFERSQRFLNIMPPFISYGMVCGIHLPLAHGVASVIIPQLKTEELGKLLLKYKPTHMACVPTHYQAMMKDPKLQKADLSFLKTTGAGGDSINVGAEGGVNEFLLSHGSPYKLCKGYGATECSSTATTCMGENNKLGSVGFPLCLTTVGIFEPDTDNELGYNEDGEVCVCGPGVMKGYLKKPEESAKVLRVHSDGKLWLHTGDMGHMDEDGYIYIGARFKRIIIRPDCYKVYPAAIENAVGLHPDVETCSAVACRCSENTQGAYPVVHVVLKDGVTRSHEEIEKELREYAEKGLVEYALPIAYKFCDSLPYTPSSKVDYMALQAEFPETKDL